MHEIHRQGIRRIGGKDQKIARGRQRVETVRARLRRQVDQHQRIADDPPLDIGAVAQPPMRGGQRQIEPFARIDGPVGAVQRHRQPRMPRRKLRPQRADQPAKQRGHRQADGAGHIPDAPRGQILGLVRGVGHAPSGAVQLVPQRGQREIVAAADGETALHLLLQRGKPAAHRRFRQAERAARAQDPAMVATAMKIRRSFRSSIGFPFPVHASARGL